MYIHYVSDLTSFQSSGDDLQVVRDSLKNLRTSFSGSDSQHQNIDQLEQSISVLMDRLHVNEQSTRRVRDYRRVAVLLIVVYMAEGVVVMICQPLNPVFII